MTKNNIIIEFKNVTKDFSLQNHKTFKEFFPALIRGEKTVDRFTALSDISFTVNKGENLGIIGPNGSGKSTILKLIANVMTPTSGKVTVIGKVSPLIELGAGFHPELTGRENIFLNGAILGLSQREINQKLNEIIDFSELSQFIDQPIKYYSSGMYMRLAFSVAINVNPDVLLIDEILGVGDTAFQEKCFRKMEEFKKSDITIIFVSHAVPHVLSFCQRCLYLNRGVLRYVGDTQTSVDLYQKAQANP